MDALISAVTACVVSVLSACIVLAVLAAFDRWSARGRRAEHAVVGAPTGDRWALTHGSAVLYWTTYQDSGRPAGAYVEAV